MLKISTNNFVRGAPGKPRTNFFKDTLDAGEKGNTYLCQKGDAQAENAKTREILMMMAESAKLP
jgi:hypothetical protein